MEGSIEYPSPAHIGFPSLLYDGSMKIITCASCYVSFVLPLKPPYSKWRETVQDTVESRSFQKVICSWFNFNKNDTKVPERPCPAPFGSTRAFCCQLITVPNTWIKHLGIFICLTGKTINLVVAGKGIFKHWERCFSTNKRSKWCRYEF